ncbi:MAG: macro domain-containing protein, partial [Bacilli bacterium]|nr:macro domain-containing protein [Bacilli bacterium]
MSLSIVRNDLVKMHVDVIVNSANPKPIIGAGVDERIHTYAGEELIKARLAIGDIACGEAKITDAYNLHAKYVIHTVGPIHTYNHVYELLSNCYRNSLLLAKEYKCKSIAFPLISTGTYGVDKAKALQIAIQTIHEFLLDNDMMVYLV